MITLILAPFRFLRWAFTNGWKGIIVLMVVIVVVLVGFFVMRHYIAESMNDGKPAPSATPVQVTAGLPTAKQAPYEVHTWSRTYYAVKAVKNKDGTTTITDYWEVNKNRWIFTKGSYNLDESFGKVTIIKRSSL